MSDVITISREQQDFLNCQSNYVCCMAYAGSGKTFILKKFSEKYKEHRILYLAYNKGVQQEAQRKFPDNVKVVTTHALAYRYFADLKQKIKLNFGIFDLAKEFNITSFSLRFIVYKTLSNFYFSADESINISHVPKESQNKKTVYKEPERIEALSIAIKAYCLQADPENDFPCPPDFFIKHYQLTGPSLDKWYDIILLDEAQDVNMVTKALLDKCSCMRIYVGEFIINAIAILMAHALETADIVTIMTHSAGWIGLLSVILSAIKINDINLYSSSLGLSNTIKIISKKKTNYVFLTVSLGMIGTSLSVFGILNYFVDFLSMLGVIFPPIAGVMLVDYYILKTSRKLLDETREQGLLPNDSSTHLIGWSAIIACIVGTFVGVIFRFGIPSLNSILVAGITYWLLMKFRKQVE